MDPCKSESFENIIIKNCDEDIINKTVIIDIPQNHYITYEEIPKKNIRMDVMVSKANYGPYLYYRIKCDKDLDCSPSLHPFSKVDNNQYVNKLNSGGIEIGEVVADNEMIRKMFEYLSMDDDELDKYTGNKHSACYRASIINSIVQFWD
jgi:hypothetical protein